MIAALGIEAIDGGGIKSAHAAEFFGVAADNGGNRGEPGAAIGNRGLPVRLQDGICNGNCKGRRELLHPGDTVQRLLLVEARHFDGPFDRNAASTDFKAAFRRA